MPHFSSCCKGADEYICQKCAKIFCSGCKPSSWRPDITGHKSAGNICPSCLEKYQDKVKQMKARNKLYEANIFGVWVENDVFIFKNRQTEDKLILTKDEVIQLAEELEEWARSIDKM